MLRAINTLEWQVLRALLRHKGKDGLSGAALRLSLVRRTKDGSHLAGLAAAGLIEAAGEPDGPDDAPAAMRTPWRLTDKGRQAAEYGEYDDGAGGLALPTPAEFAAAKQGEPAKKKGKG